MKRVLLALLACTCVLAPQPAAAQDDPRDRAVVTERCPIYSEPNLQRLPLRMAALGTRFIPVKQDGDWLEVKYQDPQFGLRNGYVLARYVRVERFDLRPLDLSVPDQEPTTSRPPQIASRAPASGVVDAPDASGPPSPQIEASSRLPREGFWFNFSMGVGSLGCQTCGGERANGLSGGLSLGGTLNPHWYLGFGSTGWTRDTGTSLGRLSIGTADFRVRGYPSKNQGFYITGGLGIGTVQLGDLSETGAGAVFGLGWDIRVGRNVSLTPYYNGFAMASDFVDANVAQVGIGITIH